jgi:hypothetical protein
MLKRGFEQLHPEFVNSDIDPLPPLFGDYEMIPLPYLSVFWRGGGGLSKKRNKNRVAEVRVRPGPVVKDREMRPTFGMGVVRRVKRILRVKAPDFVHKFRLSGNAERHRQVELKAGKKHRRNAKRWR